MALSVLTLEEGALPAVSTTTKLKIKTPLKSQGNIAQTMATRYSSEDQLIIFKSYSFDRTK